MYRIVYVWTQGMKTHPPPTHPTNAEPHPYPNLTPPHPYPNPHHSCIFMSYTLINIRFKAKKARRDMAEIRVYLLQAFQAPQNSQTDYPGQGRC